MKFDAFSDKLEEIAEEFRLENGRDIETVDELREYLRRRKVRVKGRRQLTSLKGFNL